MEVVQPQAILQSEEVSEVQVHNQNYKGKNYDPNFQVKHAEATHSTPHTGKQQQNSFMVTNQYKTAYNKPTSTYGANNNTPLTSSSDIVGEVTLKTSVDGYQLLKVNEMIKNAVAWRARMPKASKFSKYFNDNSKDGTQNTPEPKVHINEATARSYGSSCQRLWLHRTRVCQSGGDVPVFRQPKLGGCPHPQLTGLTTKVLQT